MAYTDINSEDRLVQRTFADYLERKLGWDSVYAYNEDHWGHGRSPATGHPIRAIRVIRSFFSLSAFPPRRTTAGMMRTLKSARRSAA